MLRPLTILCAGLCALGLLTACEQAEPAGHAPQTHLLCLPVVMGIPDEAEPLTRALGDPGTYEKFRFPRYAYVYLVVEYEDGSTLVCPTTDNKGVLLPNPIDVGEESWTRDVHPWTTPQTAGDSLYLCSSYFYFNIEQTHNSSKAKVGRVYAAMTRSQLPALTAIMPGTSTESEVLAMTFDVKNGASNISADLQDLYSTPYNYMQEGRYYGTVTDVSATSAEQLNLLLYHVASKVDVMWNVAEERQASVRISHVEARKLKQQGCKLFRPTENTWTDADEAANYSLVLMEGSNPEALDLGRQWYGRHYFYTIPFKKDGYFDVNLHLWKNGDSPTTYADGGYNLTMRKNLSAPAYSIFVPWLRPDLRFSSEMTYGNVTKTID